MRADTGDSERGQNTPQLGLSQSGGRGTQTESAAKRRRAPAPKAAKNSKSPGWISSKTGERNQLKARPAAACADADDSEKQQKTTPPGFSYSEEERTT